MRYCKETSTKRDDLRFGKMVLVLGIGVFIILFLLLTAVVYKLKLYHTLTKKVETDSKRHGGELVAQVLQSHGVKYVFTLVGGHISPILVSCEHLGIQVIDTRHEANAVFAADAVARLSGSVGVVAVTAGPGLTNTVTAVKNAQMAESPILLIGGAAATLLKGRGALQDIDQLCLFKPLCKFTATITRIAEIIPTMKRALQIAPSGTPGPVFIEFPIDVLYPYGVVLKEAGIKNNPKGFVPKVVNWYISNSVKAIFAGAWETVSTKPLQPSIDIPKSDDILKAWNYLKTSKKPVFILGSQVTLPPVSVVKLKDALNDFGIPCFLGGMARGLLGRNCDLHIRQRRRDALAEADVIFLIGTVCDFRLSYGRVLNKKSTIIAVNRNTDQLYKNSDIFWKPTLACRADPATFVIRLSIMKPLDHEQRSCVWASWVTTLKDRDIEKEEVNKLNCDVDSGSNVNPVKLLHVLEESLAENSILVADGGDFVGTAAYILRPRAPLSWLDPGAFGTLGVGGGFALGAKLVRPDADVWIIWGDGSCGYSIAEYDTFKRFKVPIIGLVGNDACWSQIAREQVPMFNSSVACNLLYTDYHKVAEGYGGIGLKLESCNVTDIHNTFKKAKEISESGSPVLINVIISKSNFRAGSISV